MARIWTDRIKKPTFPKSSTSEMSADRDTGRELWFATKLTKTTHHGLKKSGGKVHRGGRDPIASQTAVHSIGSCESPRKPLLFS